MLALRPGGDGEIEAKKNYFHMQCYHTNVSSKHFWLIFFILDILDLKTDIC